MSDIRLQCTAAILQRGKQVEIVSDLVFLLAGLALIFRADILWWLMVLVMLNGMINKYYAIRVALDADLFRLMAQFDDDLVRQTERMDQELTRTSKSTEGGRPWSDRARGAKRFLVKQCSGGGIQLMLFFCGLLLR